MNLLHEKMRQVRRMRAELANAEDELLAMLGSETGEHESLPRLAAIQTEVANHFQLPPRMMRSKLRPRAVAWPRQVAMALCRECTDYSLERIAAEFQRDHGTVMHAIHAVRARCDVSARDAEEVALLRARLAGAMGRRLAGVGAADTRRAAA